MRSVAILAGFFPKIEVRTRIRFGRLFTNDRLHWITETSRKESRGFTEPSFPEFRGLITRLLTQGYGPLLVLIANPYDQYYENIFRDFVESARQSFTNEQIAFPPRIGPTAAEEVYNELGNFFGFSSAAPPLTPELIHSVRHGRRILCVTDTEQATGGKVFRNAGLTESTWTESFDEFRIKRRKVKNSGNRREIDAETVDKILTEDCSHLIWALGYPPHRLQNKFKEKLSWGNNTLDAVLSFAHKAQEIWEQAGIERAIEIQNRVLLGSLPQLAGFDLARGWRPALPLSGDYGSVVQIDSIRIGMTIADIQGKGLPAALAMADLNGKLRSLVAARVNPSELCQRVNEELTSRNGDTPLISMFYGELDQAQNIITYTNAGHNHPMLFRKDGSLLRLDKGGLLLGAVPEVQYEHAVVSQSPGDLLFMFTDGVSDALDPQGQQIGEQRLIELIRNHRNLTAERLRALVLGFCTNSSNDDLTFLILSKHDATSPCAADSL